MLAYLFWHRSYDTVSNTEYEHALLRFQEQLSKQSPPGFRGGASFHVAGLPWLGSGRRGYEDWCLVEGSWALDPLNAIAVAGPVVSAHDSVATQMEEGHGGLYSLVWGEPTLPDTSRILWLTRPAASYGVRCWTRCGSGMPKQRYGAGKWCSGQARSLPLFQRWPALQHPRVGRCCRLNACA